METAVDPNFNPLSLSSSFDVDENENENGSRELPKKIKILTAVAIFFGNVAFACAFNSYGPVITSLQKKYDTDDATISRVFTILTGCYMMGALLAGIIYNYLNRQLAVIIILSTMAAMTFLTPHCSTMTLFFITAAVMGLCCGSYDTAQFVWMMEMMQKDCPPYVQAQQFFYAVGTNLPALIMAPFLDKNEDEDDNISTTTMTMTSTGATSDAPGKLDKLFIPYTILGLIMSIADLFQILLFIFFRYHPPPPEIFEVEGDTKPEVSNKPFIGTWSLPKLRMVILSCCFFAADQGMAMSVFQFFSKFGQNSDLHLSESQAAYVLTGMTASYAVGRGIAFIAVFKISTKLIICADLVLVLIANCLLVGWAIRSLPVLWTCSILFGLGMSSLYASFGAFIERYLYFTNFIGSLVPFCGSGVASIYPLVVGIFIETNPNVLSYTSFFSILILVLAFGSVIFLTRKNKTRY